MTDDPRVRRPEVRSSWRAAVDPITGVAGWSWAASGPLGKETGWALTQAEAKALAKAAAERLARDE